MCISREELSKRFYRDALDAMLDAPGVIITGGGDRQDISLRGMGSAYTLMLIDGKRQSSRETRTNSDSSGVEAAWTPPVGAIERIEVVRGPMSSLYGSDAIGGVINIITRKVPLNWQGEVRLDSTLQQDSQSGDQTQGNFFLTGPMLEKQLGLQLYGQYSKRDEDRIISGYRGRKADNLTARFAYTPNENHDILLETGLANQTFDSTVGKTVQPAAPGKPCPRGGCPQSSVTEYETGAGTERGRWHQRGQRDAGGLRGFDTSEKLSCWASWPSRSMPCCGASGPRAEVMDLPPQQPRAAARCGHRSGQPAPDRRYRRGLPDRACRAGAAAAALCHLGGGLPVHARAQRAGRRLRAGWCFR